VKRRELLKTAAALGLTVANPFSAMGENRDKAPHTGNGSQSSAKANPLKAPEQGSIPVAFLISEGAVVIDFSGPWQVFEEVDIPGRKADAFQLYTVGQTTDPVRVSGGMKIVPDYTLETAPPPKVVVIPAQSGRSQAMLDWIRSSSKSADVVMSVCTGAFLLASTGLLSGRAATTHHNGYKSLSIQYPQVQVKRGVRFVEDGIFASSGGLSCGIDLALRVVERYYGREIARNAAYQMEYQGQGWMNPDANAIYAKVRASTEKHPLCAVCEMDVDPVLALKSTYKNRTYYFCSREHKNEFYAAPDKFANAAQ